MSTNNSNDENFKPEMKRFGIVFDIDGVLLRGKKALPNGKWALETLQKLGVPYALLTNGGGTLESTKKESVERILNIKEINAPIILAHTPMREILPERYRDKRCLILGHREELKVAKSYGLTKLVTPQILAAQNPTSYEGWGRDHDVETAALDPFIDEPIEAIVIMHDPVDYHLELQVCIDVLRGRYPPAKTGKPRKPPKVYNANQDLEFAGSFAYPRLAQGSFLFCLETLHEKCPGGLGPLEVVRFGKPNLVTYQYSERQLRQLSPHVERFYMVGDNPEADIRGANNAGDHWTSVLVKTGVFPPHENNSATDPADVVTDDVKRAIEGIFKIEGIQISVLDNI
jgi:HAD superfamily hydrolase (TIGR01456 family)